MMKLIKLDIKIQMAIRFGKILLHNYELIQILRVHFRKIKKRTEEIRAPFPNHRAGFAANRFDDLAPHRLP